MMTTVELPRYVEPKKDRHGRPAYYYFRRHGRRWKLPGKPFSEEFAAEYQRLLTFTDGQAAATADAPIDKRSYSAGSFGALVTDYLSSAKFKQLKPSTRAEYTRVLEALQWLHGDKPVSQLRRRHVRKMRDARADTPGAA
jgi:hypothetical protein